MSAQTNRPVHIQLSAQALQSDELLLGLDTWLQLGLITDSQVKALCQRNLTCALPVPEVQPRESREEILLKVIATPKPRENIIASVWKSLKDEFSVRWLLFLGIFLVVLSSGMFAATQWQNFPVAVQYGVLWSYTVVFWGVGFWVSQRENLQLTTRTIQTIFLLLVPLNFWAMDSFGLGTNAFHWLIIIPAIISLSGLTALNIGTPKLLGSKLLIVNLLGLSYLHWGWQFSWLPLIATYLGTIFTALVVRRESNQGRGLVIYALGILLVRAIVIGHVPIEDVGLAVGICGWLFASLTLREEEVFPLTPFIGYLLLFFGWLVSVTQSIPWQAVVVSLLALQFLIESLLKWWRVRDLGLIFGVGLQLLLLLPALIPIPLRQDLGNLVMQTVQANPYPYTTYGIALFPYLILWVGITDWLQTQSPSQSQSKLAKTAQELVLILGIILMVLSFPNPVVRSLNLICSTITLGIVTHRRLPVKIHLIYLTHLFSLLSLGAIINSTFPSLSHQAWVVILEALLVAELGLSILRFFAPNSPWKQTWYGSCWHFGLILAGLNYALILDNLTNQPWELIWLLTPLTLTLVAKYTRLSRRKQGAVFSIFALVMAQLLSLWQPETRLISLGFATVLMVFNTKYLRHQGAAIVNLGFGISFAIALFWGQISTQDWFLAGAFSLSLFWLMGSLLGRQTGKLVNLYAQAADNWAITIFGFELVALTCKISLSYVWIIPPGWGYLFAACLSALGIGLRYWQQPNNFALYGFSVAIEIIVAEAILLAGGSTFHLAIANIILALITLFLTYQKSYPSLPQLHHLPLLYIVLGMSLRSEYFNSYTGLLTLGAALGGLGVGISHRQNKTITYLSVLGISGGIYELVVYQLQQASGGNPGDGGTILAIIAASIALVYRLLAWFCYLKGKEKFLNLNLKEIRTVAHLHWALGSVLNLISIAAAVETTPKLTLPGIIVSGFLGLYALIQARNPELIHAQNQEQENNSVSSQLQANTHKSDWWIYVGLVELLGTTLYIRLIWTEFALLDPWRVVLACGLALLMYQIPWNSWGWQSRPWQRATVVLPALTVLLTSTEVSYLSLLAVAVFYGTIAKRQGNIRWTYISLLFLNWAVIRWLTIEQIREPLGYVAMVGLSLLYIAQLDPQLKLTSHKQLRHNLRIFAMGIICITAMVFYQNTGIIPAIISLVVIFAGLGLRVRAFLFVGTATFVLTVAYQLTILSFEYPISKWVIGLLVGIVFISIAANFEQRREQLITIFQNWLGQLSSWE